MRADVFQAVALCCHANAYLTGASDKAPDLVTNSTFAVMHELLFERTGNSKLASGVVADAPAPWLRRLSKEGVEKLGLSLLGCPYDPLIPATEQWGILSDGDVGVEIWQPTWRKRFRTHGDSSPWRVSYASTRAGRWTPHATFSFSDTAKLLKSLIHQTNERYPIIYDLLEEKENSFPDIFPEEWPAELRELGELATRTATLMRSEQWAQVILRREMSAAEHDVVSQKIWKASLMALEAASKLEEAASEHPTVRSFPLAG